MNREWREYVNNRCMYALYENKEFVEKEKSTVKYIELNNEARYLCYVVGFNDANELFNQGFVCPSIEEVHLECENVLKTDVAYCALLAYNQNDDLLQERAEKACYEAGFKKVTLIIKTDPH